MAELDCNDVAPATEIAAKGPPGPAFPEPRVVRTKTAARDAVRSAQQAGLTVGLVPTMGALHEGHASLIRAARAECGFVAATIFVNPTQFGPTEDLGRYPRTWESDVATCRAAGADLIFAPGPEEMYPRPADVWVVPGTVADGLCGAARPGHFRGVATVVAKLFHILPADRAYFGRKDAQQCAVIRRMVADLDMAVELRFCDTVREPDGLAMSSRNRYLAGEDRRRATCLWHSLQAGRATWDAGARDPAHIRSAMSRVLAAEPGITPEYAEVVHPDTMQAPREWVAPVLLMVAARVGPARLIDNVLVEG